MREHFPFTDYDFYAYLASGFGLLFALDYAITSGTIALRGDWTFVQIVLAIAAAYATGHIVASLSSPILEHWFARTVLYPPAAVLTGLRQSRWRERVVARLVGRYYDPLSSNTRAAIVRRAAAALNVESSTITDPEDIFQVAFPAARTSEDARRRMDDFRNQYGFCRNVAFASLVGGIAIGLRAYVVCDGAALVWSILALVLGIGMLIRFLKFYCSYAAEVLRTFGFGATDD